MVQAYLPSARFAVHKATASFLVRSEEMACTESGMSSMMLSAQHSTQLTDLLKLPNERECGRRAH